MVGRGRAKLRAETSLELRRTNKRHKDQQPQHHIRTIPKGLQICNRDNQDAVWLTFVDIDCKNCCDDREEMMVGYAEI